MTRLRSNSVDFGELSRGQQSWVGTIRYNFRVINPFGGANPRGNCTTCAVNTGNYLINGTTPQLAGPASEVNGAEDAPFFAENDEDGVWNYLWTQTAPGRVYVVEDEEDHVYNVVRRYHGPLYLVDSNLQNYREITRREDLTIRGFNYLLPGEEGMRIYLWGALSDRWS